nr:uncharacterized protein CI109_000878 [Kwoniella shandongensis]KAA5530698.1 hypothetical protein CI109_000878 [Kwoniella shandongensis]
MSLVKIHDDRNFWAQPRHSLTVESHARLPLSPNSARRGSRSRSHSPHRVTISRLPTDNRPSTANRAEVPPAFGSYMSPRSTSNAFHPTFSLKDHSGPRLGPPPLAQYVAPDRRFGSSPRQPHRPSWVTLDERATMSRNRLPFTTSQPPPPPPTAGELDVAFSHPPYSTPAHTSLGQVSEHRRRTSPSPNESRPRAPISVLRRSSELRTNVKHARAPSSPVPGMNLDSQRLPAPLSSMPLVPPPLRPTLRARTYSGSSHRSGQSQTSQRGVTSSSGSSICSQAGQLSVAILAEGNAPRDVKKKRTRALMTHSQQAGLSRLWKKTKFPTGNDREHMGSEIGLTSRQVQNQRQKGRKALLVNGGIPEGEDPADYEDLQKSPRARRLSIEQEERISAWAGHSSTASTYPSSQFDVPQSTGFVFESARGNHKEKQIRHPDYADDIQTPSIALYGGYPDSSPPLGQRPFGPIRSPSPAEDKWKYDHGLDKDASALRDRLLDDRHQHVFHHHHHETYHSHQHNHNHHYPGQPHPPGTTTESNWGRRAPASPVRRRPSFTHPVGVQYPLDDKGAIRPSLPRNGHTLAPTEHQRSTCSIKVHALNLAPILTHLPNLLAAPSKPCHGSNIKRDTSRSPSGSPEFAHSNDNVRPIHLPPTLIKFALNRPLDQGILSGENDLPCIESPTDSPKPRGTVNGKGRSLKRERSDSLDNRDGEGEGEGDVSPREYQYQPDKRRGGAGDRKQSRSLWD